MTNDRPDADDELGQLLGKFQALDEEQLYAELGASHFGETLGVRPSEFGRYLRTGRLWFEKHESEIRERLCSHERIVQLRASLDRDQATELATIVDILLSLYGQIPAAIVAIIITRRGLDRLCPDR